MWLAVGAPPGAIVNGSRFDAIDPGFATAIWADPDVVIYADGTVARICAACIRLVGSVRTLLSGPVQETIAPFAKVPPAIVIGVFGLPIGTALGVTEAT